MKIKVRTLQNNEEEINFDSEETILDVKKKIQEVLPEMEYDKQKLIFGGKILKDEIKANEILNENDTVIVMVTKKNFFKKTKNETEEKNDITKKNEENINDNENKKENTNLSNENKNNIESLLLTGNQLNEAIENICNMGFQRKDVEKAMKLAYNNPNRAVDYLSNGFPNENELNTQNIKNENVLNNLLANNSNAADVLNNSSFLTALRDVALSNPQRIPEMLEIISRTDPSLLEYIRDNQTQFLNALQQSNTDEYNTENSENTETIDNTVDQLDESILENFNTNMQQNTDNFIPSVISLTENELESIKKLEALGFPKHMALEAFIACDKNEEMAANYLFENMDNTQ